MKRIVGLFVTMMCVVVPLSAMGPGENGMMGGSDGMRGPGGIGGPGKGNMSKMQNSYGMSKFDKYTITTIKAVVDEVGSNELNSNNRGRGTHLYVKSNRGYFKVHVAPEFWITQKKIEFSEGEKLVIKGSVFKARDENNMYAVSITRVNGDKMDFRDPETGDGLWKKGMAGEMKNQNMKNRQNEMREKMMKQNQEKMRQQMMKKMQGGNS